MTKAWAVAINGAINVRTVTDSRTGAILNWLVTEHKIVFTDMATSEVIEHWWNIIHGDAQTVEISLEIIQ